ncbi:MAG: LysR family transcriptional regulator [Pseudomonadota bacterium]
MTLHLVPRSLQYLEQVAHLGSIQAASRELGISASAIHRQIAIIEESLGETVFDRDAKGMTLTYAGRLILDMARNWRLDSAKLQTIIQSHRGIEHGHLKIAAMDSMVNGFARDLVEAISRNFPKVTLEIEITSPSLAVKGVINGDFDIAAVANAAPNESLKFHWSREFPLGCIATPDHPIAQKDHVDFEEFVSHSVVFQGKTLAIRNLLEAHYGWIFERAKDAVVVNSIQLMKLLVLSGDYVAVTSELDANLELTTGRLAFVPIFEKDIFKQTISLVTNAQIPESIACKKVLDQAVDLLETAQKTRESVQ